MRQSFHFFAEHALHSALVSDTYQTSYVHIPVNASTWGKTVFAQAGFKQNLPGQLDPNHRLVIFLRDPIDRWLSGLATWLTYRLPQHTGLQRIRHNTAVLDILFDSIRQDDHTERQLFFIQGLDLNHADFWWVTPELSQHMASYFLELGVDTSKFPISNASDSESGKAIPKTYFRAVMESNLKYLQRVKDFFAGDRDLIRQIPFKNCQTPVMSYYDY